VMYSPQGREGFDTRFSANIASRPGPGIVRPQVADDSIPNGLDRDEFLSLSLGDQAIMRKISEGTK
jgi:hypothetical protein